MSLDLLSTNNAVLATLILLALRELFSWLRQKNLQTTDNKIIAINDGLRNVNEKVEKTDIKIDSILQMSKTMYDWHDKADEIGRAHV